MKSIIIATALAALLAVVFAQGDTCCTPKKWEGQAYGFSAIKNASIVEFIHYDFINKQTRVDIGVDLLDKGTLVALTLIEKMSPDNKVWKKYHINAQTSACTYTEGGFMREACVPSGSIHDFAFTIGGSLKAHSYFFDAQQGAEMLEVTVSEDRCIPIRGIALSHHGKEYGFESVINYFDITEGIRDPFVFQTPDDCKKQ